MGITCGMFQKQQAKWCATIASIVGNRLVVMGLSGHGWLPPSQTTLATGPPQVTHSQTEWTILEDRHSAPPYDQTASLQTSQLLPLCRTAEVASFGSEKVMIFCGRGNWPAVCASTPPDVWCIGVGLQICHGFSLKSEWGGSGIKRGSGRRGKSVFICPHSPSSSASLKGVHIAPRGTKLCSLLSQRSIRFSHPLIYIGNRNRCDTTHTTIIPDHLVREVGISINVSHLLLLFVLFFSTTYMERLYNIPNFHFSHKLFILHAAVLCSNVCAFTIWLFWLLQPIIPLVQQQSVHVLVYHSYLENPSICGATQRH